MPAPRFVKIGAAKYVFKSEQLDGKYGDCHHMSTTIRLHPEQAACQLRDTVLHETLHAVSNQAAMFNTMDNWGDFEERFVSQLTPWLLSVIRDNPALVKFLQET